VTGCELVIVLTLIHAKPHAPEHLGVRVVPCAVVKRNWARWLHEGRLVPLNPPT
jgi:hypothetical protein